MKRNACQTCVFAVYDDKPHCGLRGFREDFNVESCSAENDTVPNGYELQEDGYFSWVEKKNEYPKTYEDCCKVLGISYRTQLSYTNPDVERGNTYLTKEKQLLDSFMRLRICRNTYWKIAGEEMCLGKPWKPDWTDTTIKHCIEFDFDIIRKNISNHTGYILAFPTEEMRNSFYESFKELIEICKEFI